MVNLVFMFSCFGADRWLGFQLPPGPAWLEVALSQTRKSTKFVIKAFSFRHATQTRTTSGSSSRPSRGATTNVSRAPNPFPIVHKLVRRFVRRLSSLLGARPRS